MPASYGWKAANWPRYLVWDQYQVDFLRTALGDSPEISVVGEIWFVDQPAGELNVSDRAVAVFDVQPFRDSKYRSFALNYEYYVPDTTNKFMEDIHEVVSELKLEMAFKKKREIKSNAHPRYRNPT
jgi:polysaccharide biosynthesis PFTS motif protein